jgi:hypothetical protein
MVGATDVEKLRMQIKWLKRDLHGICKTVWWTSERLKEAENNVPAYFVKKYGVTEEAINEAYFLGRQDGRLTMAKAIKNVIGEEEK